MIHGLPALESFEVLIKMLFPGLGTRYIFQTRIPGGSDDHQMFLKH